MRVPQVNERVKEAPAHALRAMFAGIGQLLSVSDKIRNKSATAQAPAEAETVAPETMAPETMAPETMAPETMAPETMAPETVAPETVAPETVAPETVAPETVAPKTVVPAATVTPGGNVRLLPPETSAAAAPASDAAPAAELPVANYDELSVASLRARLRNLSAGQLGQLIEYEKSHAGRADVISMFERRIAKLAEG